MDEDLEKLQLMKAKTMFEIVEGQGPIKVLFLTNPQAEFIGSSTRALRKMLQAFEIPPLKLVINLMTSVGLRKHLNLYPEDDTTFKDGMVPDIFHNRPPFATPKEERQVQIALEAFMSDVVLPLAVSNQAVILADAIDGECALATALSRAYQMHKARWGRTPPFTILSITAKVPMLYFKTEESCFWPSVRQKSKEWTKRITFHPL